MLHIAITGSCQSSGYEMVEPEHFTNKQFKDLTKIFKKGNGYWNKRMEHYKKIYIDPDPKYAKRSLYQKLLLAQKKVRQLETEKSWPETFRNRYKSHIEVANLVVDGSNLVDNVDKFEKHLEKNKVTHVIHQIPGHWRIRVKDDETYGGHYVTVGPRILFNNNLKHLCKSLFNKPKGLYNRLQQYKELIIKDPEIFDKNITAAVEKNKNLEKKYGFISYYICHSKITSQLPVMNDVNIIHDDIRTYSRKHFKIGCDTPMESAYNDYVCDIVALNLLH